VFPQSSTGLHSIRIATASLWHLCHSVSSSKVHNPSNSLVDSHKPHVVSRVKISQQIAVVLNWVSTSDTPARPP
jgi:hypothetical protein